MLFTVLVFHEKGFSCSFNFYLGSRTFVYHTLIIFPAEKVKENFHCDQPFFFSLQLSVRYYYLAGAELGSEGPG